MNTVKRLSLGQEAEIGTLYNAHNDTFLDTSLFAISEDSPLREKAVVTTELRNNTAVAHLTKGTIGEKFDTLGVSPELGASLLAGLLSPRGSARYLVQQQGGDAVSTAQRGVVSTVTSRIEQLNMMSGSVRNCLDLDVLEMEGATHVLTGITWGSRVVVSVRRRLEPGIEMAQCEANLEQVIETFLRPEGDMQELSTAEDEETLVRLYTDVSEEFAGGLDLAEARKHFSQLRHYVEKTGGKPLVYTLLPLEVLTTLYAVQPRDTTIGHLSLHCYENLVGLFDHIRTVKHTMNDHRQRLLQQKALVSDGHFSEVDSRLQKVRESDSDLRVRYAEALKEVRSGRASSQTVSDLVDEILSVVPSPQALTALTVNYDKKLDFLSRMVGLGAVHVGETAESLQDILERNGSIHRTMYALYFSNKAMGPGNTVWKENLQLMEELLSKTRPKPRVLLVDCDVHGKAISQSYVSVYAQGMVVVENLLQQNKELAGKHLMKYDRSALQSTKDVPSYRKSVRLPCPGPYCDRQDTFLWSCSECQETVEFGSRDGFFYCDCGRVPCDSTEFNCQGTSHKAGYYRFARRDLQYLLQKLPDPREVNILIMGETGVGKSTFVNAFVNYLTYGSLDEGLKNPGLNCIIPCSFTTQVVDNAGRMISKDIVIGSDNDEVDGSKGQSATQKATVYPLYFKDTLVRLIDTPGIGDTRGLEQDKQNMANMLSILRNYPALHGILILLKPNNARLGVMFRFCVKELLTHLHTSAAQNMVFGFTNTRGSNYTPGDTFKPLESLLFEYRNVIPELSSKNVYCFDSESFRYLAARKQGTEMGHIDDYRRSWDHSAKEAGRLLTHFQSLRPHHTQETLSLNETRHLIAQLTAPMQQISVAITETIEKSEQQMQDLMDAELTVEALRHKLEIQKTTVKAQQLSRPKTVCANESCVESVFDQGSNSDVLLRKKLCHNPCCLTNVPVGKVGTPQLENCAAFAGPNCTACGHHWREHEHILVEYSKQKEKFTDPTVQRELTTTGNVVKAKSKALKALQKTIDELKHEHRQVQTAAARFSLYLKTNSITHYNDATIEYLEHLIRDERTKVRTGQNRARLESLERDLDDYRKFVETMEQGKSDSDGEVYVPLNEAGVAKLVQTLYNLTHYGQMLKDLAQVVASAYEASFRERPYRISRQRGWRGPTAEATAQNWSLFGRRTSVRNSDWVPSASASASASALTTTKQFHAPRSAMPGAFDQSYENNNSDYGWSNSSTSTTPYNTEKSWSGSQPRHNASGSWPLPDTDTQGSLQVPVQSIINWGENPNPHRTRSSSALGETSSTLSSAPPPYPGPNASTSFLPWSNHTRQNQTNVVEKRGVWGRLKDRLKRW